LEPKGLENLHGRWFPDGQQILVEGNEPGRLPRTYIQPADGSQWKVFTPEGVLGRWISQDGKQVIANGEKGGYFVYPVEGGRPRRLAAVEEGYFPIQWSGDGQTLYLRHGWWSGDLYRVNVSTGERSHWMTIVPTDPAGIIWIHSIYITRDGKQMVYGYGRAMSDLYVVDGLK